MANKERFAVAASSLGSYFGCGFNDPLKQLMIDMGEIEDEPDDEALARMELGNLLEDASLNVIEYKLKIKIGHRNVDVENALDGKLRIKLDGETVLDGEETVVENKVSNSNSGVFTSNKGYEFQCQAYMMHRGWNQALLCGLYHGKPIWKVIRRNDEMIEDIKIMVEMVYGILNGILPKEEFPWELVHKYSSKIIVEQYDTFDPIEDGAYLERLPELNEQIKSLEDEKSSIVDYLKNKYQAVAYEDASHSLSISQYERAGGLDTLNLEMDHPEIDLTKYQKAGSVVTTVRAKRKKVA